MKNKTFPRLTQEQINNSLKDDWDFLFLFIDHYFEYIDSCENPMAGLEQLDDNQHTLLAFNYLYGQVTNGGFLQLIENGYGSYVLGNPFSNIINKWGAERISKIVDKANLIYQKDRANFEKEKTLEEFSAMYDEFHEFEPLDDNFYEIMDEDVGIIKNYVYKHINDFAVVKENEI